ncbi:SpaA isopeptide-forming pilin-related protein [Vagococcus carniphilus]|uniref:SpaA isopeptide-forming pilin-related protein n=2 Tax=Vagococcus carniphilus TaxID=218144 RepID=UPI002891E21E|nr:SpaA isopeptide-forming pilin-related protein [Vagococcus carniphilus]MDT2831314.1 SpaA isopeptide-forming pilin-related protein [Vagococcus carniphilus]MDT2854857.1 SpaA isopeptide-forming pilin-related protein [Vagococcus carniphilus]
MKRIFNLFFVVLMTFSPILTLGETLVKAAELQDMTSQLLQEILVDKQEVSDGGRLSVTAKFDDRNKKIESGDVIKMSWPTMNNVKAQGFATTVPINVKGVVVGQAVITVDGAVVTFNDAVNQFKQGTVKGGVNFQVQVNNLSQTTSTDVINIVGGNIATAIKVSKEVSHGGGIGEGIRNFSDKNGVIYVSDPTRVFWDISLNGNRDAVASDIKMSDQIKDSPTSHKLLPETFYIEVKGATVNKTLYGLEGIEQLKRDFQATFNYSVEEGTIEVVIPRQYASYNSFRIAYYTQITDMEVASFKNNLAVDYQVYNKEPQHDVKQKVIENISGNAWGEGTKTSQLVITKKDSETKQPLIGAEFILKDINGLVVAENLISDEKGQLIIDNLEPNDYILEETKAPEGYQLLDKPVLINVNKAVIEKEILNIPEKLTGGIEIRKVDSKNENQGLSGAKFKLTSELTGEVNELITDGNGMARLEELDLGKYNLEEIEAPKGYQINSTVLPVEIVKNKEMNHVTKLIVTNEKIPILGSLEVSKIDSKDSGTLLPNAVFELTEEATGKVSELVTDETGKVNISGLSLGKYRLKEITAPKGYLLDSKEYPVVIKENEVTDNKTKIEIKNTKVSPWVPLTPSTPLGSVSVTKVDSKDATKTLPEAEFKLTEISTGKEYHLVTDVEGKAVVAKLPLGQYKLEETKAPKGYVLDKTIQEIEVKADKGSNNTTYVTVKNEAKLPWIPLTPSTPLGSVSVTKVDSKDATKTLPGAEFKLTEISTGKEYPLVTDVEGKAVVAKLPLGQYKLEETKAPKGYVLDKTIQELEVKADKSSNNTTHITMKNEAELPWIPLIPSTPLGSVSVTKVDSKDITKTLPGAEFKLTEISTGKEYPLVTDVEGKAVVAKLPLGQYKLEETKAPKGYVLDKTIQELEVKADKSSNNTTHITMKNEAELPWIPLIPSTPLGSVSVTKVDSKDVTKTLPEAEFKLTEIRTGKEYHLVTDVEGKAVVTKLPLGQYKLEETKAPKGYVLDKTIQEIEVKADKGSNNTTHITVKNEAELPWVPLTPSTPLGSVSVTKVDSKDATKTLPEAEFKLTELSTGKEYHLVTDAEGKAVVTKLPLGKYKLEETKAPKGYVLDKTIQEIEVKADKGSNNTTHITVKNEAELPLIPLTPSTPTISVINPKLPETGIKKINQLKVVPTNSSNRKNTPNMLPKTGENISKVYLSVVGLLLLTGFIYLFNLKKIKN